MSFSLHTYITIAAVFLSGWMLGQFTLLWLMNKYPIKSLDYLLEMLEKSGISIRLVKEEWIIHNDIDKENTQELNSFSDFIYPAS